MKIVIKINTDSAAFEDAGGIEVARILEKLAEQVRDWHCKSKFAIGLRDINGNWVGTAEGK